MSAKVRILKLLLAVNKTDNLLIEVNKFYSNYFRKKSLGLPDWELKLDKIWTIDLEPWSSEVKTILKPYIIQKLKFLYNTEYKLAFKVPAPEEGILNLYDVRHPWNIFKNQIYKLYDLSMFKTHDYIGDQVAIDDDNWSSAEKAMFKVKALRPPILINPKKNRKRKCTNKK